MKKGIITLISSVSLFCSPALASATSFADVVFLIDQSGSMYNEFAWVSTSLTAIDSAMSAEGLTTNYALAGYEYYAGYDSSQNAWMDLPSDISSVVSEAEWAAANLYGGTERGYDAVDWAMDNFSWTGGDYAKILILVTDEDADYGDYYSYGDLSGEEALAQKLSDEDVLLNVITSSNLFTVWDNAAFSKDDYIGLFDLEYLRTDAEAFTAEFTAAKINEIVEFTPSAPQPVPEPATIFLFGAGLAGFGRLRSRVQKDTA